MVALPRPRRGGAPLGRVLRSVRRYFGKRSPALLRSRQGIDLKKYPAGGYEIELADGIQSRFFPGGAARGRASAPPSALLMRAQQDLSAELFESAHTKFLQVIDASPDCGEACGLLSGRTQCRRRGACGAEHHLRGRAFAQKRPLPKKRRTLRRRRSARQCGVLPQDVRVQVQRAGRREQFKAAFAHGAAERPRRRKEEACRRA